MLFLLLSYVATYSQFLGKAMEALIWIPIIFVLRASGSCESLTVILGWSMFSTCQLISTSSCPEENLTSLSGSHYLVL